MLRYVYILNLNINSRFQTTQSLSDFPLSGIRHLLTDNLK